MSTARAHAACFWAPPVNCTTPSSPVNVGVYLTITTGSTTTLPDLKAWEEGHPTGAPALLVVSTGTEEANRAQNIRSPLVLDHGFGVGQSFGANGTPMAVLVDAEGRIASELAAGGPAVLGLLGKGTVHAV